MRRQLQVRSVARTGMFLLAMIAALYFAREIFLPIALSVTFALILRPVVSGLHRCRIPESIGAGIAVLGVLAVLVMVTMNIYEPAMEWARRAPETLRNAEYKLRALQSQVKDMERAAAEVEKLAKLNQEHVPAVQIKDEDLQTTLARFTANAIGTAVIVIVLLYFLLATRARLLHKALALLVEPAQRPSKTSIVMETEQSLSRYLFTIAAKNLVLGIAVGAAMWAWNMPNPVLWGVMAGVLNFVPFLGDLTGITITTLVALVTYPDLRWAAVPLTYFAITSIEGLLVTPLILGRSFALDPVVVFVWLVFWGWLWGIGGALLAMPMLVILRIVSERSTALATVARLISDDDGPRRNRTGTG